MIKIALPIKKNKLSLKFDKSSEFVIFTVGKQNRIIKKEMVCIRPQSDLFPYKLANKGVTDLISSRIDVNTAGKFNLLKINVFVGVKSVDPELLVKEYLDGTLETNDAFVKDGC